MYAASDISSTVSLSDSLRRYLYHHRGERRFQASSGGYGWPCDSTASKFELLSSSIMEKTYENGVAWEPYEGAIADLLARGAKKENKEARIMDLGSGCTSSWLIAMAEMFPHVECIGIDLIPSDLSTLPPNVTIEIHDLYDGLPYPDGHFNLVHCRFGGGLGASFSGSPDRDFFADASRVLRPGGVFLLEEEDNEPAPFYSSIPNNPFLGAVYERHRVRTGWTTYGQLLADRCRRTTGFDPALVQEVAIDLAAGARAGSGQCTLSCVYEWWRLDPCLLATGPPERQRGTMVREAWLETWTLQLAASGADEATIERERRKDELALPERDVGLFCRMIIVWAVKEGGR